MVKLLSVIFMRAVVARIARESEYKLAKNVAILSAQLSLRINLRCGTNRRSGFGSGPRLGTVAAGRVGRDGWPVPV